ncbi:MAG: hypothetical protein AB4206_03805 [Xenococcaceae cyanobacterium]
MTTLLSPESQTAKVDRLSANISNPSDAPKVAKCYQADQQVKYLHLQAEIEVLLQELQTLKQQKYNKHSLKI